MSTQRSGILYLVCAFYDRDFSVLGAFTVEQDADAYYTRLRDRQEAGDGSGEYLITTTPLYVRTPED